VKSRFACSIKVWPDETSTKRVSLHCGQSEQPRPDPVNLTRAPVKTMTHNDPRAAPHTALKFLSEMEGTIQTVLRGFPILPFFGKGEGWLRSHGC
jgi:hypothetical protein